MKYGGPYGYIAAVDIKTRIKEQYMHSKKINGIIYLTISFFIGLIDRKNVEWGRAVCNE